MISDDPWPWFSHQHDANYETGAAHDRIVVFDNGNTRRAEDETAHSRGQVLRIDEQSRTVRLDLNADLGEFARALGSAQRLGDGNYHFNLGWTAEGLAARSNSTRPPIGSPLSRRELSNIDPSE